MKIIGGTFGVSGSVWISRDKKCVVNGIPQKAYTPSQIGKVTASQQKSKRFGALGFIAGSVILAILLGAFLGALGVIIGIVIAAAGSFYSTTQNILQIDFVDDNSVTIECTPRFASRILALKNS